MQTTGVWAARHGQAGVLLSAIVSSASFDQVPTIYVSTHDRTLSSSEVEAWINGTALTNRTSDGDTTGTMGTGELSVGWIGDTTTPSYLNGWIGELAMFDFILSTEQVARLHNYLSQKWGIKLA
jgi:hypothetical protein